MQIIDLDENCVIKWRLTDICNYQCSYCIRRKTKSNNEISNLDKDFSLSMKALQHVKRIAEELYLVNGKNVKVDLIGGEISLFDNLNFIIESLFESDSIIKINITTNLFNNIDYYINLCEISNKYNKKITITASFHPEHENLDNFISKAKILHELLKNDFKCETVITDINTQVNDFVSKCEEIGCRYMCEEDIADPTKHGETVRNYKVNYRYKVIDDEGNEQYYYTRNEVIKRFGKQSMAIPTEGLACSRDYDYVYLEQDSAIPCKKKIPIEDYHVLNGYHECPYEACTLCGHISIVSVSNFNK